MASVIVCPACQARNRPKWEYCARCGEALKRAAAVEVGPREEGPPRDLSTLYLVAMVAVVGGTFAMACRDLATQPPPAEAKPGVFAFGGRPQSPLPATAAPPAGDAETARRLLGQGKAAEAIPLLEKAAADHPESGEYRRLLGRARWLSGDREGALQSYAEAASLDPAAYRLAYAQALEMAGRLEEATGEFEGVVEAQPSSIAKEGLSRLYYRRGEYAKALPLLEGVASQTHDPVVLQQLAYAAEKSGDRERAIATYRDVIASEPRADIARGRLAETLFAAGRKDDAVAVLQEGLERTPDVPVLQRGLGNVLEQSGRAAEAAAAYREYARLAPNAPDARAIAARAARLEAEQARTGS